MARRNDEISARRKLLRAIDVQVDRAVRLRNEAMAKYRERLASILGQLSELGMTGAHYDAYRSAMTGEQQDMFATTAMVDPTVQLSAADIGQEDPLIQLDGAHYPYRSMPITAPLVDTADDSDDDSDDEALDEAFDGDLMERAGVHTFVDHEDG